MKLRDFGLLTGEDLDPEVIVLCRQTGFNVWDGCENGLQGSTDAALLQDAFADNRVIVSHDADFGTLAVLGGEPVVGIVHLRPGHINPTFTIQTVEAVLATDPDLTPPFILVARRNGSSVAIRIRTLTP